MKSTSRWNTRNSRFICNNSRFNSRT